MHREPGADILEGHNKLGFQEQYCKYAEPNGIKYGHRSIIQLAQDLVSVLYSQAKLMNSN